MGRPNVWTPVARLSYGESTCLMSRRSLLASTAYVESSLSPPNRIEAWSEDPIALLQGTLEVHIKTERPN
jgi:hypothetical protein